MKQKQVKITIYKNYEEDGYEVFIGEDRANKDSENSILYAAREHLKNKLPIKTRTIWIG